VGLASYSIHHERLLDGCSRSVGLGLDHNMLSGTIPESLAALTDLV
jgi:hypothetical protein